MTSVSHISRTLSLKSQCGLGQIDFVNCLPVTTVLLQQQPAGLSLVMGTPGYLNKQYRDKKLDLGAMSSHYFLEDGGFELFPNISIASKGAVGSVLFFCRGSLERLKNIGAEAKIGVPEASASSVRLLHILLAETCGFTPQFVALEKPETGLLQFDGAGKAGLSADGAPGAALDGFLLFGDSALTADFTLEQSGHLSDFQRFDLGQWWFEKYQLPVVFGVWAARKSWIEKNSQDFKAISAYLAGSYPRGLDAEFPTVVAEAARRTGLSSDRLRHYYKNELDFTFDQSHGRGLELYRELCTKYRLL